MSVHPHVPGDDDALSILDLVDDCREVSGVLAPYVPTEFGLPRARAALSVEIDATVAAEVAEWGDYGS